MAINKAWTREELILTLNLYLKLPFGKLHARTPEIIHLASLIERTPGSVAMRLNNFASVDPFHLNRGIKGLPGGRKQVEPVWMEFEHNREELLFESERLLAAYEKVPLEQKFADVLQQVQNVSGIEKLRLVRARVNQNVFRQVVLTNYLGRCAITGINIPDLLVASHIVPWSVNEKERLNPANGICLSPLYDKAFDKGLIGIDDHYRLRLSKKVAHYKMESYYVQQFSSIEGQPIRLPEKYLPGKNLLAYHMETIFQH